MSAGPLSLLLAGQSLIEQPVAIASGASRQLAKEIAAVDCAITNFEASLDAPHAWPVKAKTLHTATPEAMASLKRLGFGALALANNHAYDLGQPGVLATRSGAQSLGFAAAGSGADLGQAASPAMFQATGGVVALFAFDLGPQADMVYAGPSRAGINGLRVRKRLLLPPSDLQRFTEIARQLGQQERMAKRVRVGYSEAPPEGSMDFYGLEIRPGMAVSEQHYPDADDLSRALQGIAAAKEQGACVVASLHHHHWDPDWRLAPDWLVSLCAALVDAGATAVFCHGSPLLQGMGLHRGRPVFYGLGNFIFHTGRAARYDANGVDVWRSAVGRCEFDAAGILRQVNMRPIRVGAPADKTPGELRAPELLQGAEAQSLLKEFLERSVLGNARVRLEEDGCIISPA